MTLQLHLHAAACCRESVAINASLMTLGRCLEALRWNQQHRAAEPKLVPYRESKVSPFTCSALHTGLLHATLPVDAEIVVICQ